jgi:autotransporter translocation and assembly factor TamB
MTSRSTRRRTWLGAALGLLALIVAIVGLVAWIIATESGTRWAFHTAGNLLNGALQAREIDGTLATVIRRAAWRSQHNISRSTSEYAS